MFSAFELEAGSIYREKASLSDHAARLHPVGEFRRFVNDASLPYHAGLTSNVVNSGGPRWVFLLDDPKSQGDFRPFLGLPYRSCPVRHRQ